MATKITVAPSDVWGYFHAHKDKFGSDMYLIAESGDGLTGIYITEQDGDPQFIVESSNEVIDEDMAVTKIDCEETAKKLYADYLGYDADDDLPLYDEEENEKETINEREEELDLIFQNLVLDILGDNYPEDNIDDITDDIKEHVLEYMARRHGLTIYRPMFLEDEDGVDFYSEYPYEEMIFEDCNPIYDPD